MDRQCSSCGGFCKKSRCERENVKPEREWVSLTADEIAHIALSCHSLKQTADAIEAKLKERNYDK